jgi:quercetin dioxygenase-like cupin family protein
MKITYPLTIDNGSGETLIFMQVIQETDGDKVLGEARVQPRSGPPLHVHWLQDECFTVVKGKLGYQVQGGPEQLAGEGESILFKRGVAHRFWNAGEDEMQCKAWVKPAHNFVFFLSAIFAAQQKTGTNRPAMFDAAYLLRRYRSEYDMLDIPVFVKKVVMPATYFIGKLLGKYRHFKDAPEPVKG